MRGIGPKAELAAPTLAPASRKDHCPQLPSELSARTVLSRAQAAVGLGIAFAMVVALFLAPSAMLVVLGFGACALGLIGGAHQLLVVASGARGRARVITAATPPEDQLPSYTILAPLYREAAAVGGLVRALLALDYPSHLLEVKLIVEHDDHETLDALESVELPAGFELMLLPDGVPKTKPRACNFALRQVHTEMVVIFDAEDRPEPDQLLKAASVLRAAPPDVACLQAHLDFWNPSTNLMTRLVTAEYSCTWELFRPGLDRLGSPLPLGGTSNHFPTRVLRSVGAWDEFNVTEDIDLGVRLDRAGYRSWMLDTTTYEEANTQLGNWIRQRSRWIKGWLQTWLVHNRHPIRLIREVGLTGVLHFNLTVLSATLGMLFSPVIWTLAMLWLVARFVPVGIPGSLLAFAAGSLLFCCMGGLPATIVGLRRRGYHHLAAIAVLMPFYDLLKSFAAMKGIWQLLTRPHYWEKTTHGLDHEPVEPPLAALVTEAGRG